MSTYRQEYAELDARAKQSRSLPMIEEAAAMKADIDKQAMQFERVRRAEALSGQAMVEAKSANEWKRATEVRSRESQCGGGAESRQSLLAPF